MKKEGKRMPAFPELWSWGMKKGGLALRQVLRVIGVWEVTQNETEWLLSLIAGRTDHTIRHRTVSRDHSIFRALKNENIYVIKTNR